MVLDPSVVPGAPNGSYYLGTQVGVYRSLDRGLTWSLFSQGLPNAVAASLSVVMFKNLGVSNTEIALYTSALYLPGGPLLT